jgi:Fe-S-cluster containining protein
MADWRSSSRKRKARATQQRNAERARDDARVQHLGQIAGSPVFQRVMQAQHQAAWKILAHNSEQQGVLLAAADTLGVVDYLGREHLKVLPPEHTPACRQGCHHCCYLRVQASVPEILLLAEWLQTRKAPDELHELRSKLRLAAADPRVLSPTEKPQQRIACALLSDGVCGAYEARPLACRGFTSMDAEVCRRSLDEDGPASADAYLLRVANGAGRGLALALADAELGTETLELTRALDIALNEQDVFARWSAGEPVFAPALLE